MPGFDDHEKSARRIASTFDDQRVTHFFDPFPAHRAGKAFAEGRITRGPAWDIYFFYKKGQEWKDAIPEVAEWMHQLGGGERADANKFRTGQGLVRQLHSAMSKLTGSDR